MYCFSTFASLHFTALLFADSVLFLIPGLRAEGVAVVVVVVEAALDTMEDGQSRMLDFGVSNAEAWEVGLACGGRVQVFVEPVPPALDALQQARLAKRPVVLATPVEGPGSARLVFPDSDDALIAHDIGGHADAMIRRQGRIRGQGSDKAE